MRVLTLPFFIIASISAIGQKQFNKKMREENYNSAIAYAEGKIDEYKRKKSGHKLLKLALPYYVGIGKAYRNKGDYAKAEMTYLDGKKLSDENQSAKARKKLGATSLDIMDALADMQLETGNYRSAGSLLEKSIAERKSTMGRRNLQRYRPYLFYAKYLLTQDKNDEAYQYLKDYVLYIKNTYHTSYQDLDRFAEAYETLARLELDRGDLEQALYFAEKNYKYQPHEWVRQTAGKNNLNRIESCNLMARCWMFKGDFIQALSYSDQAATRYNEEIGAPTIYKVPMLMTRGELFWNQQQYENAFVAFKEANEIQLKFANETFGWLSEYEKENFAAKLKGNSVLFYAFVAEALSKDVTIKSELLKEAYFLQINSKAKILDESNRLFTAIANSSDPELKTLFSQWSDLKNEYARLVTTGKTEENSGQLAALEKSIDEADKKLATKAGASSKGSSLPDAKQIANVLTAQEAAIEIIPYGKYQPINGASPIKKVMSSGGGYLALILTSNSELPKLVMMPDGTMLEGRVHKFYTNSKKNQTTDTYSYPYYFGPLAVELKNVKTIYFSPDGIFNLVNLSILSPSEGRYVQDDFDIINVTNTKNLLKSKAKFVYATAALMGRPQYNSALALKPIAQIKQDTARNRAIVDLDSPINDLPGTETEVMAIHDLLTAQNIDSKLMLYDKATEASLKSLPSKDILHIATHGFFLDQSDKFSNPMLRSGILLAGVSDKTKGTEDGVLTAYEATLLSMSQTKLVVLSACETGLGDIKNGEGVYGLQRSFEAAGVQNILMSLWKVDDQATMELMRNFYTELLKTNDTSAAFASAQRKLRIKYPHPYYWGAFKMMGR